MTLAADLRRGGLPGHDQAHDGFHFRRTKVSMFYDSGDSLWQIHQICPFFGL